MKTIIQVPCLNEETTIGRVIADIRAATAGMADVGILIIDDGCSDGTVDAARAAGADYIARHATNQGLARAFMTGLSVAALATLYGSSDRETWRVAHARSGIDIYVVDSEGVRDRAWARSFPVAPRAGAETIFALNRYPTERCTMASERNLSLVDAACFEKALAE